jgi:hypothetical protein
MSLWKQFEMMMVLVLADLHFWEFAACDSIMIGRVATSVRGIASMFTFRCQNLMAYFPYLCIFIMKYFCYECSQLYLQNMDA